MNYLHPFMPGIKHKSMISCCNRILVGVLKAHVTAAVELHGGVLFALSGVS